MKMDLFGDLPEPTSPTTDINSKSGPSFSLYGDVPTQTSQQPTKSSVDNSNLKRKQTVNGVGDAKKTKSSVKYVISSYLAERQGEREDMQDAHVVLKDYTSLFTDLHPSIYRLSFYAIFDGHGGVRASRFASQHLHKNIRDKFPKGDFATVEKEIRKSFMEAFKKTDEEFLKEAAKGKPVWKDGTTAILVLIINETMYIANIGDSQAVLCRSKEETGTCVPVALSVPHNPSMYEERMRVQKHGGHVKDGRVMGVLEVSRSLGDGQYKKLGVTCTPDVKKCQLTHNDRYVVIACDGLWKCFEPDDCIKFVNKILETNSKKDSDLRSSRDSDKFDAACNKLASEAVLRFSGDNVTVLLLAIKPSTDM